MLRVLLVEDSRLLVERLKEALAQLRDVELVASVSDEAAAIGVARHEHLDVIILDLQLKHGTGFGVLQRLGDKRPTVIVFTNYVLPEYERRAAALGVEYFLNKARDYERLPLLLQELEQRQREGPRLQ